MSLNINNNKHFINVDLVSEIFKTENCRNNKIEYPIIMMFCTYKNLLNVHNGKYKKESISVYEMNGDFLGNKIDYYIVDDILIVHSQKECIAKVYYEYEE